MVRGVARAAFAVFVRIAIALQFRQTVFLQNGSAATLYTTTGLVYATILASGPQPLIPWVNVTLHYVMPLVVLLDWLTDPSRIGDSRGRAIATWLAYAVLYGAYSLIRGAMVGWYPYGFLDPRPLGYGPIAVVVMVFALGATAIAWGLLAISARKMTYA